MTEYEAQVEWYNTLTPEQQERLAPCGYCRRCAIHDDPGGCLTSEAEERAIREEIARAAYRPECDFCGEKMEYANIVKFATNRPSNPDAYCSVMWGCGCDETKAFSSSGKSDAEWAAWCSAHGKLWEG